MLFPPPSPGELRTLFPRPALQIRAESRERGNERASSGKSRNRFCSPLVHRSSCRVVSDILHTFAFDGFGAARATWKNRSNRPTLDCSREAGRLRRRNRSSFGPIHRNFCFFASAERFPIVQRQVPWVALFPVVIPQAPPTDSFPRCPRFSESCQRLLPRWKRRKIFQKI